MSAQLYVQKVREFSKIQRRLRPFRSLFVSGKHMLFLNNKVLVQTRKKIAQTATYSLSPTASVHIVGKAGFNKIETRVPSFKYNDLHALLLDLLPPSRKPGVSSGVSGSSGLDVSPVVGVADDQNEEDDEPEGVGAKGPDDSPNVDVGQHVQSNGPNAAEESVSNLTSEDGAVNPIVEHLKLGTQWRPLFAYRLKSSDLLVQNKQPSTIDELAEALMQCYTPDNPDFGLPTFLSVPELEPDLCKNPQLRSWLYRALAMFQWLDENVFCRNCGFKLDRFPPFPSLRCSNCLKDYVNDNGNVECLVTESGGQNCLLEKKIVGSTVYWKTLGGYALFAEPPDDAAKRIVASVTGVEPESAQYAGVSRFWPFPGSGFRFGCVAQVTKEPLDPKLAELKWFSIDDVRSALQKLSSPGLDERPSGLDTSSSGTFDNDESLRISPQMRLSVALLKQWVETSKEDKPGFVAPEVKLTVSASAVHRKARIFSSRSVDPEALAQAYFLSCYDRKVLVTIDRDPMAMRDMKNSASLKLITFSTLQSVCQLMRLPTHFCYVRPAFIDAVSSVSRDSAEAETPITRMLFLVSFYSSDFKTDPKSLESLEKEQMVAKMLGGKAEFVSARKAEMLLPDGELGIVANAFGSINSAGIGRKCSVCGTQMFYLPNLLFAKCRNRSCGYEIGPLNLSAKYSTTCLVSTHNRDYLLMRKRTDGRLGLVSGPFCLGDTPETATARILTTSTDCPVQGVRYSGFIRPQASSANGQVSLVFGMIASVSDKEHEVPIPSNRWLKWVSRKELEPFLTSESVCLIGDEQVPLAAEQGDGTIMSLLLNQWLLNR